MHVQLAYVRELERTVHYLTNHENGKKPVKIQKLQQSTPEQQVCHTSVYLVLYYDPFIRLSYMITLLYLGTLEI